MEVEAKKEDEKQAVAQMVKSWCSVGYKRNAIVCYWMKWQVPTPATEITVRPKCDMDAEKLAENQISIDVVRAKSDLDAEAFDEDAKTSKN